MSIESLLCVLLALVDIVVCAYLYLRYKKQEKLESSAPPERRLVVREYYSRRYLPRGHITSWTFQCPHCGSWPGTDQAILGSSVRCCAYLGSGKFCDGEFDIAADATYMGDR